jgi:hypothetical protein
LLSFRRFVLLQYGPARSTISDGDHEAMRLHGSRNLFPLVGCRCRKTWGVDFGQRGSVNSQAFVGKEVLSLRDNLVTNDMPFVCMQRCANDVAGGCGQDRTQFKYWSIDLYR